MGCLNDDGKFDHWFGNIHLSGPCNRRCYFCIGQHMMGLDPYDVLAVWPLPGIEEFVEKCRERGVREVYLTGTNTEPMLYSGHKELVAYLRRELPGVRVGIRSNGTLVLAKPDVWRLYDKASVTVCSTQPLVNRAMMGGDPPDMAGILRASNGMDIKVNTVLGPENVRDGDIFATLNALRGHGVRRVNLREPYGQPHVGDPLAAAGLFPAKRTLGMPTYDWDGMSVTYWDVHWVEVESVNLYANGVVSETYPITKGYSADGEVRPQSDFRGGRLRQQWLGRR